MAEEPFSINKSLLAAWLSTAFFLGVLFASECSSIIMSLRGIYSAAYGLTVALGVAISNFVFVVGYCKILISGKHNLVTGILLPMSLASIFLAAKYLSHRYCER